MKYLKLFNKFSENRVWGDEVSDNSFDSTTAKNPVTKLYATRYVDSKLNHDYHELFKIVGMELPKSGEDLDAKFSQCREKAIKYFSENPEEMSQEIDYKFYKVDGGDGIPRTNNIGRTFKESRNFDYEMDISQSEMELFANQEPLQELIRNNKVALYNNKISFNKSDHDSIKTLDIYLDIDVNIKNKL